MNAQILVIEDQQDISELIALNLRMIGLETTQRMDGKSGLDTALSGTYDVIVLDLMLPEVDGLQICQKLRSEHNFTPILMLTAKKSESDRVLGLEVGADDYLTKPFSVLELQARVKALLRRTSFNQQLDSKPPNESTIKHHNLEIDLVRHSTRVGEREIALTAKEFDLLTFLAQHPGQVFSRDDLLNDVWGYKHSGYEHTVNSHINRLRAKLEVDPAKPEFIHTVWGVGYKFDV